MRLQEICSFVFKVGTYTAVLCLQNFVGVRTEYYEMAKWYLWATSLMCLLECYLIAFGKWQLCESNTNEYNFLLPFCILSTVVVSTFQILDRRAVMA